VLRFLSLHYPPGAPSQRDFELAKQPARSIAHEGDATDLSQGGVPALEVADIFRRHGGAFLQHHHTHLSRVKRHVMAANEACRCRAVRSV
jgi:hypothetical protein